MSDIDSVSLDEPTAATTEATTTETKPLIDPATGEPSLSPLATSTETPKPDETPTEPAKTPDADAALAVAARTNAENRQLKKQLETLQNELKSVKEKPADNTLAEKAALADAFIKNPALLLKHGWVEDKLMRHLLDPDTAQGPITQDEINKMIADAVAKATQETPEQKKAREERESSEFNAKVANTVKYTAGKIKEFGKDNYYVKEDDARGIVDRIIRYCNDKNIRPNDEEGDKLIKRAIEGLQKRRIDKYGARQDLNTNPGQTPVKIEDLDFTGHSASKPIIRKVEQSQPLTPRNGTPLPTQTPLIDIGFTD